jgi:serine phosphatase RsbU (regulator of sigma subunit)
MRLTGVFGLPRPVDVGQPDDLAPALWDEALTIAAHELARRARPALISYLGLLVLASWGSGVFQRGISFELGILGTVTVGLLLAVSLRQLGIGQPRPTLAWWRGFGVLTACNALLVAWLGVMMTIHHQMGPPALVYWVVLAGIGAGAVTSLTPSPTSGRIFVWISLGPLIVAAAWVSTGMQLAVPCIFVVFVVFMTLQAGRASRNYWEGILSEVLLRQQASALDRARREAQDAFAAQKELLAQLEAYRETAERDYAVAARIFAGILQRSCLDLRSIRATLSPLERFNGDLVMAAPVGPTRLRIFLGDFTGHGLSAAVGALPIADVFFSGAANLVPLPDVLREMNGMIRRNLPRGHFLAAFAAEVDVAQGVVHHWYGGVPSAFVIGHAGQIVAQLVSRDVPLGVLPAAQFKPALEAVPLRPGERLFAHSDGVVETSGSAGELFGEARLQAALIDCSPTQSLSEAVCARLAQHRGGGVGTDDVTLLELRNDAALRDDLAERARLAVSVTPGPSTVWGVVVAERASWQDGKESVAGR